MLSILELELSTFNSKCWTSYFKEQANNFRMQIKDIIRDGINWNKYFVRSRLERFEKNYTNYVEKPDS